MSTVAGFPKRAKRPILDDVPMPSNGSSINNTNLSSLSMDERDRLLQMLEQESSVRILEEFRKIEKQIFFSSSRQKNLMKHH
jgi:superfamily II DNA/RNA helicase